MNHVRVRRKFGPASRPFRALDEKASNLRTSGGCRAALDAGLQAAQERKIVGIKETRVRRPQAYDAAGRYLICRVGGYKSRDWLPGLDSNQRPFD